jgi:hypothetical protein
LKELTIRRHTLNDDLKYLIIILSPTILVSPLVGWLMSNPPAEKIVSATTRLMQAKRLGRIWFWSVLGILLGQVAKIWLNSSFRTEWGHVAWGIVAMAIPVSTLVALFSYGIKLIVLPASDTNELTPDLLKRLRQRFFTGWELFRFALLVGVSLFVLGR